MLPLFCPALCILNYFLFSVFITKDAKFTSASLFSHFRKRHTLKSKYSTERHCFTVLTLK